MRTRKRSGQWRKALTMLARPSFGNRRPFSGAQFRLYLGLPTMRGFNRMKRAISTWFWITLLIALILLVGGAASYRYWDD